GLETLACDVVEQDGRLVEGGIAGLDVLGAAALVVADDAGHARRQMPADRVEVRPAVVVEVREVRAPLHVRKADLPGPGRGRGVLEELPLDVAVEGRGLRSEVRHEEARPPGPEGIADGDTHAGPGLVAVRRSRARFRGRLLEGAVALVAEEAVRDAVVDE